MSRPASLFALLFALSPFTFATPPPQNVALQFQPVSEELTVQRLQRLRSKAPEREAELRALFIEAGCSLDRLREEPVKRKDPPNIICTLPGARSALIVIGAHFDRSEAGLGAVDDWTGAVLLPGLYQALKEVPRQHTFRFIGFTDEEKGLVGSTYHVAHLSKDELSTIKAMVNLECLGMSPTKVWASVADRALLTGLSRVAHSLGVQVEGTNVDKVGDDDSHPFRNRKVPSITIHSITQETYPTLHTSKDTLAAIHPDLLYQSYRLTAAYLAFLDQVLE
jgi:acetylornithine deacetylase/succinyl-diaminopimelate desuccinylase-like protein